VITASCLSTAQEGGETKYGVRGRVFTEKTQKDVEFGLRWRLIIFCKELDSQSAGEDASIPGGLPNHDFQVQCWVPVGHRLGHWGDRCRDL
jgi:hypothetical protein